MTRFLASILFFFALSCAFAQKGDSILHINNIFDLHLDSIERKVTINKWGIDSSYYLHYTVRNISKDTHTYVTNSCFYYNHSSLKIGQLEFDLNPDGGCMYNETTPHILTSGESFHASEWIATSLSNLSKGEWQATWVVYLEKIGESTYRVDGRKHVQNPEHLTFDNKTKVVETVVNNRKRKKNSA